MILFCVMTQDCILTVDGPFKNSPEYQLTLVKEALNSCGHYSA